MNADSQTCGRPRSAMLRAREPACDSVNLVRAAKRGAHEQVAVQVRAAELRPEQGPARARARAHVLPRPSHELLRAVGLPRHAKGVQLPPVLLAPRREGAAGAMPAVAAALQLHGLHAHPGRVQLLLARRAGYQHPRPRGNGPSAALRGAQASAGLFFRSCSQQPERGGERWAGLPSACPRDGQSEGEESDDDAVDR